MGCIILGSFSYIAIECAMGNPHKPKQYDFDDDYGNQETEGHEDE